MFFLEPQIYGSEALNFTLSTAECSDLGPQLRSFAPPHNWVGQIGASFEFQLAPFWPALPHMSTDAHDN